MYRQHDDYRPNVITLQEYIEFLVQTHVYHAQAKRHFMPLVPGYQEPGREDFICHSNPQGVFF